MKYLCLLISLLFLKQGFCQDLTGSWAGELPPVGGSLRYAVAMNITQTGNALSGTAKYMAIDDHWVIEAFKGTISGSNIILTEYQAVDCNCSGGMRFCLKRMKGTLTISSTGLYTVSGNWDSDTYYDGKNYIKAVCAPGTFTLSKQNIAKEELKPVQNVMISRPPIIKTFPPDTAVKRDAPPASPLDGYYKKTDILDARKMAYANLREADVIFAKRIWQEIDLREKMNNYMASPKARLIDVLVDAINAGKLTAYDPSPTQDDPGGDRFTQPLTREQAMLKLADSVLVTKSDSLGNMIGSERKAGEFNPDSIIRFRIKEDWVFDKQRSVLEPRIISIAPLVKLKGIPGRDGDLQPAFWIYFPEARNILVTKEVANAQNDAPGLSYDDIFMKRLFTSYVVKESNNQDERIKDYADGIGRLYESERVKKDLMDWELDLWQY